MRTKVSATIIFMVLGMGAVVHSAQYVNVTDYGASPTASAAENTTAIQEAVNHARSIGAVAYISSGSYTVDAATSIILDDNAHLEMHEDATLVTEPNDHGGPADYYQVLKIIGSNVTVRGGAIKGDRDGHEYPITTSTYEFGFGIAIRPVNKVISNIVIDNVHIYDCVGDSILSEGDRYGLRSLATDVLITNCLLEDCRRNNISMQMGERFRITNCTINGAGVTKYGKDGTAPKMGIDIEGGGCPREHVIENCTFSGNAAGSICLFNANETTVTNNTCIDGGILYQWSSNCVISSNTLQNAGIYQTTNPLGIAGEGTILPLGCRYVIISQTTLDFTTVGAADNNPGTEFVTTARGTLGTGDQVRRILENIMITGNSTYGGRGGVSSAGFTRNVEISRNKFDRQSVYGIWVGNRSGIEGLVGGEKVVGNQLFNQAIAIRSDGLPVHVFDNTINTASNRGIYASGTSHGGVIEGNTLINCGNTINSSIDLSRIFEIWDIPINYTD